MQTKCDLGVLEGVGVLEKEVLHEKMSLQEILEGRAGQR